MANPVGVLKAVFFHGAMLLSAVVGVFFMVFPCMIFYPINHKVYRWCMDTIAAFWYLFPSALFEFFLGVKIVCHGDAIPNNERTVMLLNHRTYFDWMFFWSWVLRFGNLRHEKIVLKASLKRIPVPGWSMQNFLFLFLNRRWEQDKPHMTKIFEAFVGLNYPLQLLIFPEGTDMDAKGKARSDAYAKDKGLPAYDYVLHPRTTGFTHCMTIMRDNLDAVYDVTVGYPKGVPSKRTSLMRGEFPREIHLNCKRYPIKEVPQSEEEMGRWLNQVWADKEKTLKRFYEKGRFETPPRATATNTSLFRCQLLQVTALAYWLISPWVALWLTYHYSAISYMLALSVCVHLYFTYVHDGFDTFEVNMLHSRVKANLHHHLVHSSHAPAGQKKTN